MDFDHMVEDINEKHMAAWGALTLKSNPPIPNTPLTAWIDGYLLGKYSVAYEGSKIKNVIGYKLRKPKFDVAGIQEIVDGFKSEGIWPADS